MVDLTRFTDRAMTRDDYKALREHYREMRRLGDEAHRAYLRRMTLKLIVIYAGVAVAVVLLTLAVSR